MPPQRLDRVPSEDVRVRRALAHIDSILVPYTGAKYDVDLGAYTLTTKRLISTIATGTAPLTVTSTTVVPNLNSDLLDGFQASEFVLLAGRSGGQTIYGGTAASNNLTLYSTSHATKGKLLFDYGQLRKGSITVGSTAHDAMILSVADTGLQMYVFTDARICLWDIGSGNPPVNPADGEPFAFSVYGDLLAGDYNTLGAAGGVQFGRRINPATACVASNYYSNKFLDKDTDGGAFFSCYPNYGSGTDPKGLLAFYAFGSGGGESANCVTFNTRSGTDTNAERARIASDGKFGVGVVPKANIHTIANTRVSVGANERDYIQQVVANIGGITSWSTIKTMSPNTVTNVYTRGIVEARVMGHTSTVGNGTLLAKWYFDIANGAPTVATISADVVSGSSPQFRLNVSTNDIQLQVQSNDATNAMYGFVEVSICAPSAAGTNANFTIS